MLRLGLLAVAVFIYLVGLVLALKMHVLVAVHQSVTTISEALAPIMLIFGGLGLAKVAAKLPK